MVGFIGASISEPNTRGAALRFCYGTCMQQKLQHSITPCTRPILHIASCYFITTWLHFVMLMSSMERVRGTRAAELLQIVSCYFITTWLFFAMSLSSMERATYKGGWVASWLMAQTSLDCGPLASVSAAPPHSEWLKRPTQTSPLCKFH